MKESSAISNGHTSETLIYRAGLDRIQEAVISARGMQDLAADARLDMYADDQFMARAVAITSRSVEEALIPGILHASNVFCQERAQAATVRAREQYRAYGLNHPREVGLTQCITEVMFDRHYQRGPRQTCSRELLCIRVADQVRSGSPIKMAIPALPFKFSSPLRTRGQSPDLAELNFLLELYEIAATIELIYRSERPELHGPLSEFTVVSDGSRFNRIVGEADTVVSLYRHALQLWIRRLGIESYIKLVDYRSLLRDQLAPAAQDAKAAIAVSARVEYEKTLWPIFDPNNFMATMKTAADVEPDPEYSNPEGRFVPLLKSLVFTQNYQSLAPYRNLSAPAYRELYREMTAHLFEPFAEVSAPAFAGIQNKEELTNPMKEHLRHAMLREVWAAAIDYMVEIKSDRDLAEDPILTCLPGHFRWTIHAKPGQLGVATATVNGMRVQAWTGVAVFKATKSKEVKLCTLPVLAAEGAGAIPVIVDGAAQPLFYLYPDVPCADVADFLANIGGLVARKRTGK